jgi:hypothetical protein
MTIRYTITNSAAADGIHCRLSLLANRRAIMMTIKPACLTLHEFARICAAKKKKPLKIRGLVSSVCQAAPAGAA